MSKNNNNGIDQKKFWAAGVYPSEDFQIDTKDDTSKPINKIHASPEAFRDQMVQIAKYSYRRTASRIWASSLRFLELRSDHDVQHESPGEHQGSGSLKNTSSFAVALLDKQHTQLLSYVAVSYCWDRSGASWFHESSRPQVNVYQKGQFRELSSSDVLYRALRFGQYHGCRNIWMDQYCIDQNDPFDHQEGIQAMDIVYQSSQFPVAVFECYIDTQAMIDALASLFTGELLDTRSYLEELDEVLWLLSDDAWFARAWTLQEAVSTGLTMKVLIGCDLEARKPEEFGDIPGEIETTLWDLQNAMVVARNWMEELSAAGMVDEEVVMTSISNVADEIFNMFPDILPSGKYSLPDFRRRDAADRQACSAAEAVNALQDRQNSVFSNRLGIIGNMCDYELRLKPIVLEHLPFAFSTCVHTLAILNGDISLLGRYSDPYSRSYLARDGRNSIGFPSDPSDSTNGNYGFSWGPAPFGSLRNIEFYDQHDEALKLAPATLSAQGLRVRGMLWLVQSRIELENLRKLFCEEWIEELRAQEDSSIFITDIDNRSVGLARDFVSSLLQTLYGRGHQDLTLTLWNYFQPRKEDKILYRTAQPNYTFEEIFGPMRLRDIYKVKYELRVPSLGIVEPDLRPSILRILLDNVCSTGYLLCGAPPNSRSPRVFFESCKPGDVVFTPRTALGDKICTQSIYRGQAVSWKVKPTGALDDDRSVIHCFGRRRGIYRMDDLEVAEYCLE